jgi:hypothetical protein
VNVFVEFTRSEEGKPAEPVLIALRAIAYVVKNPVDPGSVIFFSGLEDDFIAVAEDYDTTAAALGWVRGKE